PGSKSMFGMAQLQCIRSPYSESKSDDSTPEMSRWIIFRALKTDARTSLCWMREYVFDTVATGIGSSVIFRGSRRISSLKRLSSPPTRNGWRLKTGTCGNSSATCPVSSTTGAPSHVQAGAGGTEDFGAAGHPRDNVRLPVIQEPDRQLRTQVQNV